MITRTGDPKITVSEWIAEYREHKKEIGSTSFFKEDQAPVNQLDVTTDAIDRVMMRRTWWAWTSCFANRS